MKSVDIKILKDMFAELEKAPHIYQPSKFWLNLNKIHTNYLENMGFENFKRSINSNYFSWPPIEIIRQHFKPFLAEATRGNFSPILKSHFDNYRMKLSRKPITFNSITAFIYRIYTATLFDHVSRIDKLNILKRVEEPRIGNPFIVRYKNKLITQDLCNSVHEFYSMSEKIISLEKIKIVELGPGYGRLAYIFLKTFPDSSYCIVDIPPALFVSQNYLKAVFPDKKIFLFRPFKSFREIKKEFESSQIRILMPNQLELLPEKYFDLFINISSLHEMTCPQIKNYFKLIDKLCKGYFYTKQWRKSRTKVNLNIKEKEYPNPKNWEKISRNSPHPIQNMFFDTIYKVK